MVWTEWYTGYVVPPTQLTSFVRLYSCNITTLKMASTEAETRYREHCQILQCFLLVIYTLYKGKGEVIPLQARCGPEGG